jgi:hypothetical protein
MNRSCKEGGMKKARCRVAGKKKVVVLVIILQEHRHSQVLRCLARKAGNSVTARLEVKARSLSNSHGSASVSRFVNGRGDETASVAARSEASLHGSSCRTARRSPGAKPSVASVHGALLARSTPGVRDSEAQIRTTCRRGYSRGLLCLPKN